MATGYCQAHLPLLCAKGQIQSHRPSPFSPPTDSESGPAIQLTLELQRMCSTRSQPVAELRMLSITQSTQKASHPLQQHGTAWSGGAQICTAALPWSCAHANKCSFKHKVAVLPLAHELEHTAVSSRASKPHAICYSHRGMPKEHFQRAGTAQFSSTCGICAM